MSKSKINSILNWIIYILGYTLVILLTDLLFDTLYSESIFFDLLASIIIYILQKFFKPIIFKITIPVTGITLGLFYPFIDLFLLNIADFILGPNFEIYGIFWGYLIAITISFMNFILDEVIINQVVRKGENYE